MVQQEKSFTALRSFRLPPIVCEPKSDRRASSLQMRPSSSSIGRRLPLTWVLGMLAGFVALALYVWRCAPMTQGHFIFALDDPYISMGIAKNLLQAGTWGTSPVDFSSASSSILWPIALALGFVVSRLSPYTPYLLNAIALVWAALLVRRIVARQLPRLRSQNFWSLLLFWVPAMAAPITSLLLTGLEHIWHWVAVFSAVDAAAVAIAEPEDARRERLALWWAPALTLVRYETMALVGMVTLILFLARRFRFGLRYLLSGAAPVVLFGLWSLMQGAMFFPNSLVIKASPHGRGLWAKLIGAAQKSFHALTHHPTTTVLLFAAALGLWVLIGKKLWRVDTKRKVAALHLLLFIGMTVAHSAFASFGWLYRYEAYLLAWGSFSVCLALLILLQTRLDHQPRSIATSPFDATWAVITKIMDQHGWNWYRSLALAGCVLYGGHIIRIRSQHASARAVLATRNIYEQQYQFARFLKEHYAGQSVALNDIGAASFFPDIRVVDLYGLGSTEVALQKSKHTFSKSSIEKLVQDRQVPIAVVYDRWFQGGKGLPSTWVRVGRWHIRNNIICGDDEVSFYGTSPEHARVLAEKLRRFAPKLPGRVRIFSEEGFDLGGPFGQS